MQSYELIRYYEYDYLFYYTKTYLYYSMYITLIPIQQIIVLTSHSKNQHQKFYGGSPIILDLQWLIIKAELLYVLGFLWFGMYINAVTLNFDTYTGTCH